MTASLCICGVTIAAMIVSILRFPKLRLGRFEADTYWVTALCGALLALVLRCVAPSRLLAAMTSDDAVNPAKILILFISMTLLSVFLDEVGFFSYLASAALSHAGHSQLRLFTILYATVSVLTVFTSNDIIILTFTPFICYFAKNAGIDPLPYLFAEFVAANTWSMALIIGNPTNIYLATAYGIDFAEYMRTMALPAAASGITAFVILCLIFRRQLRTPIRSDAVSSAAHAVLGDRGLLIIGLLHLGGATVILALSSYIGIPMWIVSFAAALSLMLCTLIYSILRHKPDTAAVNTLRRAPLQLIPFVLSMFVLILSLTESGVTTYLHELLGNEHVLLRYGLGSFFSANLINNIPMSVLFSSVIPPFTGSECLEAVYAATVGSNVGAFLTPIGALAGIMWSGMLRDQGVRLKYSEFIKCGAATSIPALLAAIGVLAIEI